MLNRGSIKRRHVAVSKSSRFARWVYLPLDCFLTSVSDLEGNAVDTLQAQFSGYGSTSQVVARCLDRIGIKEPLEHWSDETIEKVVNAFTDEKFPTVIALNKIDHPDADKVRYRYSQI